MSLEHRPRRIIAGPPPMPHPVLDAAVALQQQRFQRVLLAAPPAHRPRADLRAERPFVEWPQRPRAAQPPLQPQPQPEPMRAPARGAEPQAGTPPGGKAAPREPQATVTQPAAARTAAPAAPGAARPRRATAPRAASQHPGLAVPELPPRHDLLADPQAWKHAGLARPAPDDWDVDLAQRITALCQRASPSFHSWSVTVPLDAAVLPDTELHMTLSPQRLGLRFQTQSPYSMALIARHQHRLVALLQGSLPAGRDIELELS